MSGIAEIYRAEIIRAVLGPSGNERNVANLTRLNRIADHLAECEAVQATLRAKGYGRADMSFAEVATEVPTNALGRLKKLFGSKPAAQPHPDEVFDIWTSR